jgi:hypothetical protein
LRPRLLAKGRAGRGYRAIARNGRVFLASDLPLEELTGRVAQVRLQTWHRAILPTDAFEPYGILICLRCRPGPSGRRLYETQLVQAGTGRFELGLDLGGGMSLVFAAHEVMA